MKKQYEVSVSCGNGVQRVGIFTSRASAMKEARKLQHGTYDESSTTIRVVDGKLSEDGEDFSGKIIADLKP